MSYFTWRRLSVFSPATGQEATGQILFDEGTGVSMVARHVNAGLDAGILSLIRLIPMILLLLRLDYLTNS